MYFSALQFIFLGGAFLGYVLAQLLTTLVS